MKLREIWESSRISLGVLDEFTLLMHIQTTTAFVENFEYFAHKDSSSLSSVKEQEVKRELQEVREMHNIPSRAHSFTEVVTLFFSGRDLYPLQKRAVSIVGLDLASWPLAVLSLIFLLVSETVYYQASKRRRIMNTKVQLNVSLEFCLDDLKRYVIVLLLAT